MYPTIWFKCGVATMRTGDFASAITCFSTLLRLNPEFGEGWSNLAGILMKVGKMREAYEAARQSIRFLRENWRVWDNYVTISVRSDRVFHVDGHGRIRLRHRGSLHHARHHTQERNAARLRAPRTPHARRSPLDRTGNRGNRDRLPGDRRGGGRRAFPRGSRRVGGARAARGSRDWRNWRNWRNGEGSRDTGVFGEETVGIVR